jgi:STE24 endopeptidase
MPDLYGFNEETQLKAKDYLYSGLRISLYRGMIIYFLALFVLGSGISTALESFVQGHVSEPWLVVALYTLVGYGVVWLVSLPFDYYEEYVVEHRFELSTETSGSWFRDKVKASVLSILFVFFFVEGIYNFMWLNPTYWWLFLWLVAALTMVFLMYISPVLIMPLFYKFPKLKDEELLNRLKKLAEKAGIKIIGVFEMKAGEKTKKATAALTGIGNTRRMLLSDTFLSNYSNDEIESIMGHEIGHHIYGHIWKFSLIFSGVFLLVLFIMSQTLQDTFGFFGLERVDSVASLPLLVLMFGLFFGVLTPLMNALSRRTEGQCDQYELDLVEKPDSYISAMVKLCDQNLGYAYPSPLIEFLFYDHPSGEKRVERALAYKRLKHSSQALGSEEPMK